MEQNVVLQHQVKQLEVVVIMGYPTPTGTSSIQDYVPQQLRTRFHWHASTKPLDLQLHHNRSEQVWTQQKRLIEHRLKLFPPLLSSTHTCPAAEHTISTVEDIQALGLYILHLDQGHETKAVNKERKNKCPRQVTGKRYALALASKTCLFTVNGEEVVPRTVGGEEDLPDIQ